MASSDFRDHLIPFNSPRLVDSRGLDPFEFAKPIKATPRAIPMLETWESLYREPFKGITTNGVVEKGLFRLADEGLDSQSVTRAGQALLATLSDGERDAMRYPIDAPEWRAWYNPEWPVNSHGLRLEYASPRAREAVLNLMQASLGYDGYVKTNRCRSANLYLGELYDLRNILNDWSYHFLLYGTPSPTEPWGWSLYGHHLALNCFLLDGQIVISPTFMGAEVADINRGPHDHFRLFEKEENGGLDLIRSLSPAMREQAIIYRRMKDPAMPEGRWHFADERQLGGAFRDNRVIPYEGVSVAGFSSGQQEQLLKVFEAFLETLPDRPRAERLRQIAAALDRTYFSWIGGYGDEDPFYYRVQSPVIMVEFDHHAGVWMTNTEPAKYHIHTIVRTPNGNDYGKDLLRQHYEQRHQKGSPHLQQGSEPAAHNDSHEQSHEHVHEHGDHSHSHANGNDPHRHAENENRTAEKA
jgi:hypothetical protein